MTVAFFFFTTAAFAALLFGLSEPRRPLAPYLAASVAFAIVAFVCLVMS